MDLWFIYAILSAIVGGLAAFMGKIVSARNYSAESYVFHASIFALLFYAPLAYVLEPLALTSVTVSVLGLAFLAGIAAGVKSVWKVMALRYVDTVIFFPIFKVVSPTLVLLAGLLFFDEVFSTFEWLGIVFSMLVPLLLINRVENGRQNDLLKGILFILIISVFTLLVAAVLKVGASLEALALWSVVFLTFGSLLSSTLLYLINNRTTDIRTLCIQSYGNSFYLVAFVRGVLGQASVFLLVSAFAAGGTLSIVYVIDSLYILIPIVLSIIFYREHWNARKVAAIILSIAALWFLQ